MKHIIEEREKKIKRLVLIVDDEPINRELLGMIVQTQYDVLYAENGKDAYEKIVENRQKLSLILLDIIMPGMSGHELLELLQKDAALRRIPVIVLTSEKSAEVKSLRLGAVDFIPKPYDLPDVILARVSRSIELAEDRFVLNATETDPLTNLYIREFFFIHINRSRAAAAGKAMDAIVLNVNKMHLLNELKGRACGNDVLTAIANKLKAIAETTDGIACRSESDTFFLYVAQQEASAYVAWYNEINAAANAAARNAKITLRMGLYQNAERDDDPEQAFDRANVACNTPITQYGVKYVLYDVKMREKEIYDNKLISGLDAALRENQFRVYFQPKYRITGDAPVLCSAEALVRWFHPELGFVSPGAFIPLFEENGLIAKVDRYVWNEAAGRIRDWKERYGVTVPVSVNVSRMDMYDDGLQNVLLDIVEKNELDPTEFYLEITESAYADNSAQIVEVVRGLREKGFFVEMDDFGSGYSSLNMLAELPIDALKLDMRFVRNICTNELDYRLVKLIINTAELMEIPTIAEGVETEEQLRLLKNAGCDVVQGYYFSKPLPAEEFEKLLQKIH